MFDGVQVFSASRPREREELGDRIDDWLRKARVDVIDVAVRQSSDSTFHCLTLVFFWKHQKDD